MFGLFKQKITPEEFGFTATKWANDFLVQDAAVSLGTLFDDFWDRDQSLTPAQYLERHGIPPSKTHLYIRTFAHCSVQAASTQLDQDMGRAVTRGAMTGFKETPQGYDFETTYDALDTLYRGCHHFPPRIEALDRPDYYWPILPNPKAGVLNAKYLVEQFVISYVNNTKIFDGGFSLFSGKVGAGLDVVLRAMTQISKSAKLT